jgi:hypothetical protein
MLSRSLSAFFGVLLLTLGCVPKGAQVHPNGCADGEHIHGEEALIDGTEYFVEVIIDSNCAPIFRQFTVLKDSLHCAIWLSADRSNRYGYNGTECNYFYGQTDSQLVVTANILYDLLVKSDSSLYTLMAMQQKIIRNDLIMGRDSILWMLKNVRRPPGRPGIR